MVHCNQNIQTGYTEDRLDMIIVAYLIYCGFADTVEDALIYYKIKRNPPRFKGMRHVSSMRYLNYFKLLLDKKVNLVPSKVILEKVIIE